jgi:AcrR family transcriptional regulator
MTIESARPARLPKAERRAQLLEAALEVFSADGYHSAGMDQIAERAGVTKPVLYQHFPSKLDLYLAVLDSAIDELLTATNAAIASTNDNKLRVRATLDAYFGFVDTRKSGFRLVFESDLMNEAAVRERVERVEFAIAESIAQVIATDTGLRDDQALLLGSGLQGTMEIAARRWVRDPGDISRDEAAELVATLCWRGIGGFPLTHPPTQSQA